LTGTHDFDLVAIARALRPKVFVTVPVMTLAGAASEPALLNGQIPIDPETARKLAALAPSMTRILTHPHTGRALAVGTEQYRPTADLRGYIIARDAICRFPGCTAHAVSNDIDHTVDRAFGGPTDGANLASLCRKHHILRHQTLYRVSQDPKGTGALTWTSPFGRTTVSSPELLPSATPTVEKEAGFDSRDRRGESGTGAVGISDPSEEVPGRDDAALRAFEGVKVPDFRREVWRTHHYDPVDAWVFAMNSLPRDFSIPF
jgi:hypothetical protein